jgi:hypothetical protein
MGHEARGREVKPDRVDFNELALADMDDAVRVAKDMVIARLTQHFPNLELAKSRTYDSRRWVQFRTNVGYEWHFITVTSLPPGIWLEYKAVAYKSYDEGTVQFPRAMKLRRSGPMFQRSLGRIITAIEEADGFNRRHKLIKARRASIVAGVAGSTVTGGDQDIIITSTLPADASAAEIDAEVQRVRGVAQAQGGRPGAAEVVTTIRVPVHIRAVQRNGD